MWKFVLVVSCCLHLSSSAFGAGEAEQFFKVFPVGTVEKKVGTTSLRIADKYGKALALSVTF